MLYRIACTLLLTVALLFNMTIAPADAASFNSFIESKDGYKFLYPNGWVQVKVKDAKIVFHDLIETSENVSLIVSDVQPGKTLVDLGTPTEVGYKLGKNAIAPTGSGRTAELVNAESKEVGGKTYYYLEYEVDVNGKKRHNFASVAVGRGKLFTFNASSTESRWQKIGKVLKESVESFGIA
jgi:photosystem II oxygen-evolving enhancer protein 2